jgi:hypothetical protein
VRLPDGAVELRLEPSETEGEVHTLLTADGQLGMDFPTAAGDSFDTPGFHQAGVTTFTRQGSEGPMHIDGDIHALFVDYRPSYPVQQALRRTPDVALTLRTPLYNVASVERLEKPPRAAAGLLLAVSLLCVAGGTALVWPQADDSAAFTRLRLGIGIPILAAATATTTYSAWLLAASDASTPIEPHRATGRP